MAEPPVTGFRSFCDGYFDVQMKGFVMSPTTHPAEQSGRGDDAASLNPQLVEVARRMILDDLNSFVAAGRPGLSEQECSELQQYVRQLGIPAESLAAPGPPATGVSGSMPFRPSLAAPARESSPLAGEQLAGGAQGWDQVTKWTADAIRELVIPLVLDLLKGQQEQRATATAEARFPQASPGSEPPGGRFLKQYENEHESQVATMAQAMEIALSGKSVLREMYEQGQLGMTRGLIEYADTFTQAASAEGAGHATGEAEENVRDARRDEASPEAEHEIPGLRSATPMGTRRDSVLSYFDPSLDDRRDSFLSDDSVRGLGDGNFSQDMSSVARTRSSGGGVPERTVDSAASTALDPMAAAAASRSPGAPANPSGSPDVPRLPLPNTPRTPRPQNAAGSPGSSSSRGH